MLRLVEDTIESLLYSETSIHRSRYRRSPTCIVCLIWSRN
jgi:hypothetical protein